MAEAYIVAATRTAGGRKGGRLRGWHPADLAGVVLNELVDRSGVDPERIDDVIMGCVTQAAEQAYNVARNAILSSEHDGRRAKAATALGTAKGSITAFLGSLAPWRPLESRRLSRLFARGQFYAALDGVAGVTGPGRAFRLKQR